MRNWPKALPTIGGALAVAPINIPMWLYSIFTYLVEAGTVATAISQVAMDDKTENKHPNPQNDGF
ncbi:hypothetical protein [Aequorivita sublithincola]|nr:hypothetical protein [Aequorivita sublithincola]